MSGLEHIEQVFTVLKAQGRAALMPYYTLGFPDPADAVTVVAALARSGADLIELGVPFSDPLADGPTIQHSTQVALEKGISVKKCLELVTQIRQAGVQQPLLLMGYVNPLLAYGAERFVQDAARAGADGMIIPDLPVEEAGLLEDACRACGLALVFLLPPTTGPERMQMILSRASGFVYLVSLTGVTGARRELPPDLESFVLRVRARTNLPLAVGFGISTAQQAAAVGALADGVIVGSALIEAIGRANDPAPAAASFMRQLRLS
jgi:tryptophan synthase alpha chain